MNSITESQLPLRSVNGVINRSESNPSTTDNNTGNVNGFTVKKANSEATGVRKRSNTNYSLSSFETISLDGYYNDNNDEHIINQEETNDAFKSKETRMNLYSRIRELFSSIYNFAFPKSMKGRVAEAIADILDNRGTERNVANLLKEDNPMSAGNWPKQRANMIIRDASVKRAFESFEKLNIQNDISQEEKNKLKSAFIKAMPLLAIDPVEDAGKKRDLAHVITEYLLDKKVDSSHKQDLKEEILRGGWPTTSLNDQKIKALLNKPDIIASQTPKGSWEV